MEKPWLLNKSEIKIIDVYEAEIIGEENEKYFIEIFNKDYSIIEARLYKSEFKYFPHPIGVGTSFGMILFCYGEKVSINAWPVLEYWHKSWREDR